MLCYDKGENRLGVVKNSVRTGLLFLLLDCTGKYLLMHEDVEG